MDSYTTIDEKKDPFFLGDSRIDNFQELIEIIEKNQEISRGRTIIYRGQPEAKYKLFNSLQRIWNDKQLYNHYTDYSSFISNLIAQCKKWNSGLIPKYLKNFGSENNEIAFLSIMQHYGLPTPLLDFTLNIYKSLFFAVRNLDYSPPNSEIDNYFSIYFISKEDSALNFIEIIETLIRQQKAKSEVKLPVNIKSIMKYDIKLIENTDLEYKIQNNLNILNQEGAFVFNCSPNEPIEIQYQLNYKLIHAFIKKIDLNFYMVEKVGGCININKKLSNEIFKFLKSKNIDEDSIFPDLNKMKNECLVNEWKNICA